VEYTWIDTGAIFSPCNAYRYKLWRVWDTALPKCAFIMLNPSTADATNFDPTVRRCFSYALREGCGSLTVYNIFALRSTDPAGLKKVSDPIGPENDAYLSKAVEDNDLVIVAWGNHGALNSRSEQVRAILKTSAQPIRCLGISGTGEPKHPLYLRGDAPLISAP
jgi:hypothetical protein